MDERKEKEVFTKMNHKLCPECHAHVLHEFGIVLLEGSRIADVEICLRCKKKTVKYFTDVVVL